MLTLKLPNSIGSRDPSSLFKLCQEISQSEEKNLTLDASQSEFIDPLGLATLGACLSKSQFQSIDIPWLSPDITNYMQRMDFFEHFEIGSVNIVQRSRNDLTDSCCELTKIEDHSESDAVANRLADAITGKLTTSPRDAAEDPATGKNQFERFRHPIFYSLSELIENALTHARQGGNLRASVWIASQFYRGPGIVRMAVVDNGCGFLHTLEKHPRLTNKDHRSAIITALVPKVSCNRDGSLYLSQANQGVGLTTTERIAKAAQGGLLITSGDAWYKTQGFGQSGNFPNGGFWNGVAIGFHCRRSKLPSVRVRDLLPNEPHNEETAKLTFL